MLKAGEPQTAEELPLHKEMDEMIARQTLEFQGHPEMRDLSRRELHRE